MKFNPKGFVSGFAVTLPVLLMNGPMRLDNIVVSVVIALVLGILSGIFYSKPSPD